METKQVVIANPIINSPFDEPKLHFRFSEQGITDEIALGRRQSEYFVPIARPRKKGQPQLAFETWTEDRIQPNEFINRVRGRVELWRRGGHKYHEQWERPQGFPKPLGSGVPRPSLSSSATTPTSPK